MLRFAISSFKEDLFNRFDAFLRKNLSKISAGDIERSADRNVKVLEIFYRQIVAKSMLKLQPRIVNSTFSSE